MVQPQFKGQTYGEATAQQQRVRSVPTDAAPTDVAKRQRPRAVPMAPGSLTGPTTRPQEPITAGAPFGPGPGPSAAGILPAVPPDGDVLGTLQYLNQLYPNSDLQNLIDDLMMGQ
jgi:hypothetical protein